jgi:hypothetical protein
MPESHRRPRSRRRRGGVQAPLFSQLPDCPTHRRTHVGDGQSSRRRRAGSRVPRGPIGLARTAAHRCRRKCVRSHRAHGSPRIGGAKSRLLYLMLGGLLVLGGMIWPSGSQADHAHARAAPNGGHHAPAAASAPCAARARRATAAERTARRRRPAAAPAVAPATPPFREVPLPLGRSMAPEKAPAQSAQGRNPQGRSRRGSQSPHRKPPLKPDGAAPKATPRPRLLRPRPPRPAPGRSRRPAATQIPSTTSDPFHRAAQSAFVGLGVRVGAGP